jgi:SNF2 family DNA or RNA helicase
LIETFTNEKPAFLVLYWFNFTIDDIKAAARAAGLSFELFDSKRPEIVERWNAGKIDVLAAHPQSAGMGLNLQAGGHKEIWVTLPWSSELWLQTIARLARRGQEQTVEVIRLITPGTIDERIAAVLGGKIDVQKLILDEIKGTHK